MISWWDWMQFYIEGGNIRNDVLPRAIYCYVMSPAPCSVPPIYLPRWEIIIGWFWSSFHRDQLYLKFKFWMASTITQKCVLPVSCGFTTMGVINPPEKKLAKRTSVHYGSVKFKWKIFSNFVCFSECPDFPNSLFTLDFNHNKSCSSIRLLIPKKEFQGFANLIIYAFW